MKKQYPCWKKIKTPVGNKPEPPLRITIYFFQNGLKFLKPWFWMRAQVLSTNGTWQWIVCALWSSSAQQWVTKSIPIMFSYSICCIWFSFFLKMLGSWICDRTGFLAPTQHRRGKPKRVWVPWWRCSGPDTDPHTSQWQPELSWDRNGWWILDQHVRRHPYFHFHYTSGRCRLLCSLPPQLFCCSSRHMKILRYTSLN